MGAGVSEHDEVEEVVDVEHDSVTVTSPDDWMVLVLVLLVDVGGAGSVIVKSAVDIGPVCVGMMGTKKVLVGTVRVNEAVISDTAIFSSPGLVDAAGLGATTGPTPL